MPKLVLNTLFDPVEIEVDGVTLTLKPITRQVQDDLKALDKRVKDGDLPAWSERMAAMFDPEEAVNKLTLQQLVGFWSKISEFLAKALATPGEKEKNGSEPGDKSLPS